MPAKAYDTKGLVMHCSSFSKCLAPAYRESWAAPGRYTQAIQRLKLASTLSASGPAQGALAEYLEHGGYDRHLRKLRETLAVQQGFLSEAIARYFRAGSRSTRSQGGFFLWVEMPQAVDALLLYQQALVLGISVMPGPIFSAQAHFRHALRLNYSHRWDERMENAVRTLWELACRQLSTRPSP